jgi:hypothetical protein
MYKNDPFKEKKTSKDKHKGLFVIRKYLELCLNQRAIRNKINFLKCQNRKLKQK